jgi:hypothetical protein
MYIGCSSIDTVRALRLAALMKLKLAHFASALTRIVEFVPWLGMHPEFNPPGSLSG